MILYPMNEMMTCAKSRYQLVNLVAYRARQLSTEAEESGEYLTEKPVTLALDEAWAGSLPVVDNTQE
ncbi:MAG: DNA-directed RNA polymerase subunit omega [Oscillospiraceae bacterium]|nr:DNA-directed RNA polymerase subunit omega [Oscillospiraceae bacterium]